MRGAVSLCLPILLPRGRDQVPAPVSGSRSVPLRNSKSSLAAAAQQLGFPPTLFSSSISRSPSSDRTTRVYFYNANQGYLAFKCAVVYESAWRKVGTQDSCQLHATLQPRCNNISARSDNCQIEPATAEDVMFSTMASFKDRNAVGLSVNAATACSRVVGVLQIGADVDERCIVDGTPRLLLCTTPPADKRVQESSRIRQKYPERVPVRECSQEDEALCGRRAVDWRAPSERRPRNSARTLWGLPHRKRLVLHGMRR